MGLLTRTAAALAAWAALAAGANTYTDLWFNPSESGWGVNLVQQGEKAFATVHVYGADNQPLWYSASDLHVTSYGLPGNYPEFRGTLYRTQGPWQARPFDPREVQVRPVGEISLEVLGHDRMRVRYVAEGVGVTRELQRMTFEEVLPYNGLRGQFLMRALPAGERIPNVLRYQADVYTEFTNGQGWMRVSDDLGRTCHYRGPYRQAGKLISFSGAYTCSPGPGSQGTFQVERLQVTEDGITGSLDKVAADVHEYGRFAGARY